MAQQRFLESCGTSSNDVSDLTCPLCRQQCASSKTWIKHLGHHLQQLALHAVPQHLFPADFDQEVAETGGPSRSNTFDETKVDSAPREPPGVPTLQVRPPTSLNDVGLVDDSDSDIEDGNELRESRFSRDDTVRKADHGEDLPYNVEERVPPHVRAAQARRSPRDGDTGLSDG